MILSGVYKGKRMQSITNIIIHHCTMTIFFIFIFKQLDYKFWLKFILDHRIWHMKRYKKIFLLLITNVRWWVKTRDYFDHKSDVSWSIYIFGLLNYVFDVETQFFVLVLLRQRPLHQHHWTIQYFKSTIFSYKRFVRFALTFLKIFSPVYS